VDHLVIIHDEDADGVGLRRRRFHEGKSCAKRHRRPTTTSIDVCATGRLSRRKCGNRPMRSAFPPGDDAHDPPKERRC
jgi:hypothetical protein